MEFLIIYSKIISFNSLGIYFELAIDQLQKGLTAQLAEQVRQRNSTAMGANPVEAWARLLKSRLTLSQINN